MMMLKLLSALEVVPHVSGRRLHRLLTLHCHYFRSDFEKIRNITNNSDQMSHGCQCLLIHLKNDLSTAAFFFGPHHNLCLSLQPSATAAAHTQYRREVFEGKCVADGRTLREKLQGYDLFKAQATRLLCSMCVAISL